jgi:hypothetical protein
VTTAGRGGAVELEHGRRQTPAGHYSRNESGARRDVAGHDEMRQSVKVRPFPDALRDGHVSRRCYEISNHLRHVWRQDEKGLCMADPRKGKVVPIKAGASSRRAKKQGPAKSVQSRTADQSEEWSEIVDAFAAFVWSSAQAVPVSAREAEEVFRISWLRLADHVTELSQDALAAWLELTVTRELARISAIRRGGMA